LHELGHAHSVEVRDEKSRLVGGLYGVEVGGLFAGESMFYLKRDASKVALIALVNQLRSPGEKNRLLDVQWRTNHLATLGVVAIPRVKYLDLLTAALPTKPAFGYTNATKLN
jgi:leucyl/phenylalanyl-tRNA--protein transferase